MENKGIFNCATCGKRHVANTGFCSAECCRKFVAPDMDNRRKNPSYFKSKHAEIRRDEAASRILHEIDEYLATLYKDGEYRPSRYQGSFWDRTAGKKPRTE